MPQRPTSWQTFLKAHWGAIAGADFFTTDVWTWRGLVTYYTVFVIDLASRRVQILGSTPHPEALFIPERAPNANAYAERVVRSIKEECLERLIPIGERHFRRAVTEYLEHYHGERNHQGLENRLISGPPVIEITSGVRRYPRLGGFLNFYERAA